MTVGVLCHTLMLLTRLEVVKWYAHFKREMRQRFVQMLQLLR